MRLLEGVGLLAPILRCAVVLATLCVMLPPALSEYPYARYREPAVPLLSLIMYLATSLLAGRIRRRQV